ncbi:general substrate transporter [Thozetella sp. PMI_491]|nr:general substrate transporter [Thozetella sp. PMI_491]
MKRSDWKSVTPYMLYCCLMFNAGNVLFGIDVASFGSLQTLPSFLRQFGELQENGNYALSTSRKSIMNSVNWTGKLVGCAIFEPMIERLGFKKTVYVLASIQIVAVILEISATHWVQFSVGRVLAYLAVGIVEPTVPLYQAELAPAALRGYFAGNVQVLLHLGSIWGAGMSRAYAYEQDKKGWMIPVSMQMIPAIILLLGVPFCIESPRWLITHDRRDEAVQSFNKIRPADDRDSGRTIREVNAIEQAIQESKSLNQGRWKDLFSKTYLNRTMIVTFMFFFQQVTGQQFANSYGPTFFASMGLPADKLFTYSILIAFAGLCGCMIAVMTTDTIGRRTLCYIGAALATMFGALIGAIGSKPGANSRETDSNVVVASVILLNGVCKLGVSSQCWLIGSEIGGTQMRKKLLGWGVIIDVLAAFLVTFFTPYLQNGPRIQLGAKVGYIFMGLAALSFFFFVFFTPELKGRSLEEVDELFEQKLWAWQYSKATTYGVGARITAMEGGSHSNTDAAESKAVESATHLEYVSGASGELFYALSPSPLKNALLILA